MAAREASHETSRRDVERRDAAEPGVFIRFRAVETKEPRVAAGVAKTAVAAPRRRARESAGGGGPATRRRHREDLQSIREARERAASDFKETKARLEAGRDRAKAAAARLLARLPAKRSTRGAFSRWRGRPAPSPQRARREKALGVVRGLASLAVLVVMVAGAYQTASDLGYFLGDAPTSKNCRQLAGSASFSSSGGRRALVGRRRPWSRPGACGRPSTRAVRTRARCLR